jgi:hypothetical protein
MPCLEREIRRRVYRVIHHLNSRGQSEKRPWSPSIEGEVWQACTIAVSVSENFTVLHGEICAATLASTPLWTDVLGVVVAQSLWTSETWNRDQQGAP